MEGGEEVRDAANIAYVATRPVTGTASRGAELFRRKALAEKRKRIKKVEAGKKLAKISHICFLQIMKYAITALL